MKPTLALVLMVFGIVGCATSYDEDYIYEQYRSLMDEPTSYSMNTAEFELSIKELEQLRAEAKKEILEQKKDRCREYGFKDDSDGMGLCLIELEKLEELKKANLAQASAIQSQQEDAERERIAAAWIRFGNAMSNLGGANLESANRTSMHILSSSYISGLNRICVYTLGGQKATHTISSGSICPATMKF